MLNPDVSVLSRPLTARRAERERFSYGLSWAADIKTYDKDRRGRPQTVPAHGTRALRHQKGPVQSLHIDPQDIPPEPRQRPLTAFRPERFMQSFNVDPGKSINEGLREKQGVRQVEHGQAYFDIKDGQHILAHTSPMPSGNTKKKKNPRVLVQDPRDFSIVNNMPPDSSPDQGVRKNWKELNVKTKGRGAFCLSNKREFDLVSGRYRDVNQEYQSLFASFKNHKDKVEARAECQPPYMLNRPFDAISMKVLDSERYANLVNFEESRRQQKLLSSRFRKEEDMKCKPSQNLLKRRTKGCSAHRFDQHNGLNIVTNTLPPASAKRVIFNDISGVRGQQ